MHAVKNDQKKFMTLKKSKLSLLIGSLGMAMALTAPCAVSAAGAQRQPNIVMIVADDMGYADLGAFGSEIKTPNFDALAKDGVRFTNFYTHASSSPTRATLLSGVYTHVSNIGSRGEPESPVHMTDQT